MDDVVHQARSLIDILAGSLGSSILHNHPNDLGAALADYLDTDDSDFIPTNGKPEVPSSWTSWWNWACQGEQRWKELIKVHNSPSTSASGSAIDSDSIPDVLKDLLADANCHSLPHFREITPLLHLDNVALSTSSIEPSTHPLMRFKLRSTIDNQVALAKHPVGMSIKKEHEVSRMTSCVAQVLESISSTLGSEICHIVDIGSGQGYLSCSLAELIWEPTEKCDSSCSRAVHVLGLDSSLEQIKGAERRASARNLGYNKGSIPRTRERSPKNKSDGLLDQIDSTLTFRTVWLGEAPTHESHPGQFRSDEGTSRADLEDVIDDWLANLREVERDATSKTDMIPVAFAALHACGTLTPNILRKALELRREQSKSSKRRWFVAAVVVVGCCYNLLETQDFPLSKSVAEYIEDKHPDFNLTYGHLQLAAQVPSEWLRDEEAEARADLAIKKVLYRALITPALVYSESENEDTAASSFDKTKRRVGKLNDKAYHSFATFLAFASKKIGFDLSEKLASVVKLDPHLLAGTKIARQIEVLQALRCLLGPAMESLIILDRIIWLRESTYSDELMDIDLINVFDQSMDSGRNVAIAMYEKHGIELKVNPDIFLQCEQYEDMI